MRWEKLGKLLDPRDHSLPNGCTSYAQSPQALVMDDRIRVFFSTRRMETNGKYLSHVASADFSRDFSALISVSEREVIPLGGLGCFDEHGIFPMNVVRHEHRVLGYTCGWTRRESVSVDTAIGLATSEDGGVTFQRHARGPIMASSLHEPFLIGDPFVRVYEGSFHMWYIFGTRWKRRTPADPPDRTYKIAHATSPDGLNWNRVDGRQILADRLGPDECQALPTVLRLDARYHLYFCYRESFGFREQSSRAYRIGYAFSHDLESWSRADSEVGIDVSQDGWDSEMMCYPHLVQCDDQVYLLYNGNQFGRHGFGVARLA